MANEWDKEKSTYAWKFLLDPAHPKNNPEKEYMLGYSKKIVGEENRNKLDLLKVKLVMFHEKEWIYKSKQIGIFKNRSALGFTKQSETYPIMYLTQTTYKIVDLINTNEEKEFWQNMIDWLEKYFIAIKEKKSTQDLLPGRKYDYSKDTYLDVNKWTFASEKQLNEHCNKSAKHGISFEAIEAFKRKYLEMKPFAEELFVAAPGDGMPMDIVGELRKNFYKNVRKEEIDDYEKKMKLLRQKHGK